MGPGIFIGIGRGRIVQIFNPLLPAHHLDGAIGIVRSRIALAGGGKGWGDGTDVLGAGCADLLAVRGCHPFVTDDIGEPVGIAGLGFGRHHPSQQDIGGSA